MRYLRLFARFVEFSVGRSLEFRLDFFFRVVMDLVYYLMNIAFFRILFLHTGSVGGWDVHQTMIFVSGFCVIDAMYMTLFSNNLWWFPRYVNQGDLDYHLVRPVSSLFMLSVRDFATNSFINLLLALGVLGWAVHQYPGEFGAGKIVLFLAFLVLGLLVQYLLRMTFIIPVFWTHSARGLDSFYYQMSHIVERPDRIFRGWVRIVLSWVIPFSVIASVPAHLVLEAFRWNVFLHLLAVIALYACVVGVLWRAGLRAYSSASS
ncbi:MAG: ABC transporter permease [Bdellovibrionia bacterium]